ncbi:hypothetical protein [Mycobacteroides salmoniphilum]|uniref:hypothetical protein n=1 Tax=Mycobacteroides salmoniphilum TaxID=404941 RepID=UPI0009920E4B|nr:hypothetical protein [Mycobacteroides salmoniphilum]
MNEEYEDSYKEALACPVGDLIALGTAWVHVGQKLYDSVGGDLEALAPELRSFIEEIETLGEDLAGGE